MATIGNFFPYGSPGPSWSFVEAAWHPQSSANYKSQIADEIIAGGTSITNTVPYTVSIAGLLAQPRTDHGPMYNILSTHQIRIYVNGTFDSTWDGVVEARMNKHWMAFVTWNGSSWVINNQTNFNAAQTSTAFAYPTLSASGTSLYLNLYGSSAATASSRTAIKYNIDVLNFYAHDYTVYGQIHLLTAAVDHHNLCAATNSTTPVGYYYPPWSPAPAPNPYPPPGPPGPIKVVCTAMNEEYGFGSFRSKIWLKYSADKLNKYHEIGYHAMFKPLIKIAYHGKNNYFSKVVRATIEELVTRRTSDLRAEMYNRKRDIRGRIYRAVFEPMCYVVGRIKGNDKNGNT